MNLFKVADLYVSRIVNSKAKPNANAEESTKIKALLLDKDTVTTISMCSTQTELLQNEVYLVDTLENPNRDTMRHIKCMVYISPSEESIQLLVKELQNPKYGEYHIFFNNMVSKSQLERLAEADDMEAVVKVEEIFQDYHILNEDLCTLDCSNDLLFRNFELWDEDGLRTVTESITSLLLSLKLRPQIRYATNSKLCAKLAKEVEFSISQNDTSLFDFPTMDTTPILLLLDRKNDPLTPLLQPWTYQSMIHEYIGVKRNIVDLSKVDNIDKDLQKVTLSAKQDPFFHDTMYLNFGELGDKVKQYVINYKDKTQSNTKIETIEDIKGFIEKYPEFRKLSGNVSKHMAIVGELDKQLQLRDIWGVSELEQNISVHDDNQEDYQQLLTLLDSQKLDNFYKLKLSCIYMLRHGNSNPRQMDNLISRLKSSSMPIEDVNLLLKIKKMFHTDFSNNTSVDNMKKTNNVSDHLLSDLARRFNDKLNSRNNNNSTMSDNVFMQHLPEISHILTELSTNKLSIEKYKYLKEPSSIRNTLPPQDTVVFIVGGVTYEEAKIIHEFNQDISKNNNNMRVVLGGNDILSTREFLRSLRL
ncbi:hypothetical protein TBLA_0A01850 [Henningerozyma blattae CBS 6284]|uniref:Vacuolar protein sorting-associated protein 45 n=1 Tax=Henningerozyma blattae (strain ATCC 34711 / CBS 6284 / DSM 70876 / NBRC 10599 / NRRL Y-10934 / UCD 77-7) TaxID=1071380 RepID=I2GV34_HENB6|nr:hypothetical protein TBLA_0A01850 [Tetrapisispora blattae CBS 6284]CCH57986.1 hypothetical protein TBLA_0A01850 [Tetrapisispora blattae CBS 6284]